MVYRFIAAANDAPFIGNDLVLFLNDLMRENQRVTLDPSKAPDAFSLSGEGDGGVAGFAKGGADVELVENGNNTILRYTAKAETGGKLAQLGGRLITSTAKKLSKMFFEKFEKVMSGEVELEKAS